jgi:hypothetical protein
MLTRSVLHQRTLLQRPNSLLPTLTGFQPLQLRSLATPAKPAASGATPAGKAAGGDKGKQAGGGKKKGGKESKLGNTLTAGSTGFAVGEKIPIGIFKESPDPIVKKDNEYPTWLWKVMELPSLNDCKRLIAEDQKDGKIPNPYLFKRIWRLENNVSGSLF